VSCPRPGSAGAYVRVATTDTAKTADLDLTGADDPEWVADLLDTMADGDMDKIANLLEQVVGRLRKASKARNTLVRVPAASLRAAFELRSARAEE